MHAAAMAGAEEFMLTDPATGQDLGPFTYANGSAVSLDGRTYTLTRVQTAAAAIEEKMRRIIIPTIEFRQAMLSDVLAFLVEATRECTGDPGVNMVLLGLSHTMDIPPASDIALSDLFDETFDENPRPPPRPTSTEPHITLTLRQVSLYDALHIVCQAAELAFIIDETGVVFISNQNGKNH